LDDYEKQSVKATAASYAAKINVNEKKANLTASGFSSQTEITNSDSGTIASLSQDSLKKMSKAIADGDIKDSDGDGSL
jgi:hypothetical protein